MTLRFTQGPAICSPKHNVVVKKEVDELLEAAIIKTASSTWSFPVVIAKKKDGGTRFCVHYRQFNRVKKPESWLFAKI